MEHAGSGVISVTASARDRVTDIDIRIDRAGRGEPVIVLNGLLGLNKHWMTCLNHWAARHEVFLLEPPLLEMKGPGCSVDGVTRMIAGVIEALVDRPAVMVGNSLGGHVALRMALEHKRLVRRLVLVGSLVLFERGFEKGVEHSPSRAWLERKITDLFHDPSRMWPGMVDTAHAELSRRSAARALVKLGRSAKNDHLGERLHAVDVPVLLAWGRQDIVTPPEVAEQFKQLLPRATLEWIDRCGHAPQIEQAEALARTLRGVQADAEVLEAAGLLASRRGIRGGYALIKSPDDITLGQVIRILDGPLAPISCVSKTAYQKCADCPYAAKPSCPLQQAMGEVRDAIANIVDHYTLSRFAHTKLAEGS